MVHCPDCGRTIASPSDLAFEDVESRLGFVRTSKRFYVARCAGCGTTIGNGVAGKSASGGAAGAGGSA